YITENKIKEYELAFIVISLMLLLPLQTFASEGESGGGGILSHLLWPTINFAILAITLFIFLKKPLKDFLAKRSETIERTLREAKEARVSAEKALTEVNLLLKIKKEERDWHLEKAKKTGQQEKQRLIEEGLDISKRIKETAEKNISAQLQKAKEIIRAEAVNAAMDIAEQKIKAGMTSEQQEKIISDAIKHIASQN
ncbi:MAG: ATP synthase F0 subunit B, partial [Nitrospirae bacterium]|nr:ATP synthase F0 subunit B [Nitrospirota bacterium]